MIQEIKNTVAYAKIIRDRGVEFKSTSAKAYIPKISENDYKKGFIERFFIQKINDKNASIIEISQDNLSSVQETNYYNFVKIIWNIRGNEDEIKNTNKKSIKSVFTQMPKLSFYLPNLLQFARIENFG